MDKFLSLCNLIINTRKKGNHETRAHERSDNNRVAIIIILLEASEASDVYKVLI